MGKFDDDALTPVPDPYAELFEGLNAAEMLQLQKEIDAAESE